MKQKFGCYELGLKKYRHIVSQNYLKVIRDGEQNRK